MTLFEPGGYIVSDRHPDLQPDMSPDRKRTARNRALLERGTHPATHRPVLDGWGFHCRDCVYAVKVQGGRRAFWKCERHRLGPSASAASDIRVSWPACTLLTIASG